MEAEDRSGGDDEDAARALLCSWSNEEQEKRFPQFLREVAVRFFFFFLHEESR